MAGEKHSSHRRKGRKAVFMFLLPAKKRNKIITNQTVISHLLYIPQFSIRHTIFLPKTILCKEIPWFDFI